MKRLIILTILLCNAFPTLHAQQISSPPPISSAVAKMIENPVDLSTGVPQISIPLYTLQGHKLAYPITLSYNASGIKVSEVAGTVGLGWSLNAEALITRVVRGRPDEWSSSYFSYANTILSSSDPVPTSTLMCLADGNCDMTPDMFYYSTGLDGGKFMFDNQLEPQTIPKKQLTISFDNISTLSNAEITTYDGTRYLFISGETATIPGGTASYKSTWYLSKIISVDNTDTITFNYSTSAAYTESVMKGGYLHFFYGQPEGATAHRAEYEVEQLFGSKQVQISGTKYLESIESSLGKISFEFGSRTDQNNLKKLESLVIYRKDPISRELIEQSRVNLFYSYFLDTSGSALTPPGGSAFSRLKLDKIEEQISNIKKPPYEFFYSTKELPPLESNAQDPWGYFNGAESNNTLVPATTFMGQVISTSDRGIHAEFVDGCLLNKIVSPLGGITEYFFEPNRYGTTNEYGPGMRISRIVNKDPYSKINAVTNYEYLNPETGTSSGILLERPSFTPTHLPVEDIIVHQQPGGSDELLNYYCMLIPVHAMGVGAFGSTPLVYEYVTVYHGNDYNVSGKTTYRFSIASSTSSVYPHFPKPSNTWKVGNQKEIKQTKVEGGVSTPVSITENTFLEHPTFTTIKGLNAAWMKLYIIQTPQVSSVAFAEYLQESKFPYLSESKVYTFEQNSNTISSLTTHNTFYERNDGFYIPNRVTTSTSDGSIVLQKEFKYPIDFSGNAVLDKMKNRNMISYPVETRSLLINNSSKYLVDYEKTEYFDWTDPSLPNLNRIYPREYYRGKFTSKVSEQTFLIDPANYLQKVMSINKYDESGYAVESRREGGVPTAAIVDRKLGSTTATIANAAAMQVAYSSFESSDNGGWIVDAGSQPATKSVSLYSNGQTTSIPIETTQTINYTYAIVRSQGEPVELIFTKGTEEIIQGMTMPSGGGSVTLTPGTWNASLHFDTNVSSADVDFSYSYTKHLTPNILDNDAKTGSHLLYLTSTNTISRNNLPVGKYYISFYQKGGVINLSVAGGTITETITQPMEADGFEHITKIIDLTSATNAITLSGSNVKIDELRLYPDGSRMTTACHDAAGRIQTETDVNVRSRFYEYDEWGRLKIVRDHENNILQHREYKFANN